MIQGPVWVAATDAGTLGTVAVVRGDDRLYMRGMGVIPAAHGTPLIVMKKMLSASPTSRH